MTKSGQTSLPLPKHNNTSCAYSTITTITENSHNNTNTIVRENHNMINNPNRQLEIDDQETSLQQTQPYAEYLTSSNSNNPSNIITEKLTTNNHNANMQSLKQSQ